MSTKTDLIHCSFCGKSQEQVAKLIAGPGVYICNDCVGLCNGILDGEEIVVEETLAAVSDELLLAHLSRTAAESDRVVDELRERGVDWDLISAALRRGTTS